MTGSPSRTSSRTSDSTAADVIRTGTGCRPGTQGGGFRGDGTRSCWRWFWPIQAPLPDIWLEQVSKGVSDAVEVEDGDTPWGQDPPDLLDGQSLICVGDHDLAEHSLTAIAAERQVLRSGHDDRVPHRPARPSRFRREIEPDRATPSTAETRELLTAAAADVQDRSTRLIVAQVRSRGEIGGPVRPTPSRANSSRHRRRPRGGPGRSRWRPTP